MRADAIFPNPEERKKLKKSIDIFPGTLTEVTDEKGNIIYENGSYKNYKEQYARQGKYHVK